MLNLIDVSLGAWYWEKNNITLYMYISLFTSHLSEHHCSKPALVCLMLTILLIHFKFFNSITFVFAINNSASISIFFQQCPNTYTEHGNNHGNKLHSKYKKTLLQYQFNVKQTTYPYRYILYNVYNLQSVIGYPISKRNNSTPRRRANNNGETISRHNYQYHRGACYMWSGDIVHLGINGLSGKLLYFQVSILFSNDLGHY